nr:hypothetical protein [Spirochaeta sp.]
ILDDALRNVFLEYLPGVDVAPVVGSSDVSVSGADRLLPTGGKDGHEQCRQFDVFLPDSAPGLGRLLKEVDRRDLVRVKRIAMYAQKMDSVSVNDVPARRLIDYYRTLPNCVASVALDSPAE